MGRRGTLIALTVLLLPASAMGLTTDQVVLLDRPSGAAPLPYDGAGFGTVERKAVSANGCEIVFEASSDPLFAGDENGARNLYRYSRCGTPAVTQVNTSSSGVPAEFGANLFGESISSDGNRVAFSSDSRTLDPASTGTTQVYVKDLTTGMLQLVSRGESPVGAPVPFAGPATISGDGEHVAFVAQGVIDTDNVNGVTDHADVYERNMLDDTTHMVSVAASGTQSGSAQSEAPGISNDGKVVSFTSGAQLTAADTDGDSDAYVRQGIDSNGTDTTQLVSFSGGGQTSGADSARAADVSDDGLRVAWTVDGTAWTAACNPTCGVAARQDVPAAGGSNTTPSADEIAFAHTNGGAPTRVFLRTRSPLVAGDTNGEGDLYARTFAAPTTSLLTDGTLADGVDRASATDDGQLVAFDTRSPQLPATGGFTNEAFLRALPSGATTLISAPDRVDEAGGASITQRSVSADGRFVVFASFAGALGSVLDRAELVPEVSRRDVVTGTTTLVSAAPGGAPADLGASNAAIDGAGDRVVFASTAHNLSSADTGGNVHVYLRDLTSGSLRMLDVAGDGTPGDGNAFSPHLSADGTKAAFASSAHNLPGAPGDGDSHAYLVDLASGAMQIVDRATSGEIGNGDATDLDLSADASRVAFRSNSTNFGIANNSSSHVWVRDLPTSTLLWASVPEDGNPQHAHSTSPFLSADGHKVAFTDDSASFGYGQFSDTTQSVFLRDLDAGTTRNLSTGLPGAMAESPVLSADATKVAITTHDRNARPQTFVRDTAGGAAAPAAARDGTTTPPRGGSEIAALSASGSCLAFVAASDDVVADGYGPDYPHVYLRALDAGCLPTPGGPPPPGTSDTTPPVISALSVTNKRFAVAAGKTAAAAKAKAKRGTTFRFRLSENAAVRIVIARKLAGRRKGKRCVTPTRKLARAKRCSRFKTAHALRRSKGVSGLNRVAYTGRVGKKKLSPGTYRATLTATDAAGNRSRARTISFRVVRR